MLSFKLILLEVISFSCYPINLQALRDAAHENNCLKMEIRSLIRKLETSEEAERIALEGGSQVFINESHCNYASCSHFKFWVLYIPRLFRRWKVKRNYRQSPRTFIQTLWPGRYFYYHDYYLFFNYYFFYSERIRSDSIS